MLMLLLMGMKENAAWGLLGHAAEDSPLLLLPSRWQHTHMGKAYQDRNASDYKYDHTELN